MKFEFQLTSYVSFWCFFDIYVKLFSFLKNKTLLENGGIAIAEQTDVKYKNRQK